MLTTTRWWFLSSCTSVLFVLSRIICTNFIAFLLFQLVLYSFFFFFARFSLFLSFFLSFFLLSFITIACFNSFFYILSVFMNFFLSCLPFPTLSFIYSFMTNQTCRTLLEKQGRAHKWCSPMDPITCPSKSRATRSNLHTAALWRYGM